MIDSTSSFNRTAQLERSASFGTGASRLSGVRTDHVSVESIAFLRAELLRQPGIRSEVVERARALATDPNYPLPAMNQALARLILAAPDHSKDQA